ncbi:unnamed protein product [Calypogeia fissa]
MEEEDQRLGVQGVSPRLRGDIGHRIVPPLLGHLLGQPFALPRAASGPGSRNSPPVGHLADRSPRLQNCTRTLRILWDDIIITAAVIKDRIYSNALESGGLSFPAP